MFFFGSARSFRSVFRNFRIADVENKLLYGSESSREQHYRQRKLFIGRKQHRKSRKYNAAGNFVCFSVEKIHRASFLPSNN